MLQQITCCTARTLVPFLPFGEYWWFKVRYAFLWVGFLSLYLYLFTFTLLSLSDESNARPIQYWGHAAHPRTARGLPSLSLPTCIFCPTLNLQTTAGFSCRLSRSFPMHLYCFKSNPADWLLPSIYIFAFLLAYLHSFFIYFHPIRHSVFGYPCVPWFAASLRGRCPFQPPIYSCNICCLEIS